MSDRRAAALGQALPFACVVIAVLCFQFGAALAKPLFSIVGAQGASALRLGLAALVLNAVVRPWRIRLRRRDAGWMLGYGLGLAGLNLFFYLAIRTLPLGPTVAIEFLGPLTLAILTSRRAIDALWAGLSGLGMACLLPIAGLGTPLDPAGVGFALLSAASWMAYIVCGQRAGQAGGSGVSAALGVTVATLAVLPFGIAHAGFGLLRADVLPLALAVALVSGCLPYALEMVAMKRMPTQVFGILMSLEPAFGALFGYLMLGQHLTAAQGLAIAAIMTASAGTSLTNKPTPCRNRRRQSEVMERPQSMDRAQMSGLARDMVDAEAASRPAPAPASGPLGRFVLAASLVLVSFNLRPVFSSLAALLPEIRVATGASPTMISLLTTVPVLCLGVFATAAPRLARRFGAERVILALMLTLAMGTGLRAFGTLPMLLVGSMMAGASIAVINVLLPGLVKRDFPDRVATVTAFYTMALCAGAAAAAGLTVPVEGWLQKSWTAALGFWALPALAVAVLWIPQALRPKPLDRPRSARGTSLLRSPLAWQVTLFMGLQSALAYCVFGWLAPLLRARGLDAATAGYVVSFSVVAQTVFCLLAPGLATRGRSQSLFSALLLGAAVAGFLGYLFAPLSSVWLWAALQGMGQGGLIAVALTVIVLRSPDAVTAAALSSMAQSVGYSIAAFGPLAMGVIFTSTGRPESTVWLVCALGLGAAVAGWGAGRDATLPSA